MKSILVSFTENHSTLNMHSILVYAWLRNVKIKLGLLCQQAMNRNKVSKFSPSSCPAMAGYPHSGVLIKPENVVRSMRMQSKGTDGVAASDGIAKLRKINKTKNSI